MYLNLKNDILFKQFFSRKGNELFLIDFLESLLNISIKTIEIEQEVDLGKIAHTQKAGRLDLQATLNNEIVVNIEMQVRNRHNMIERTTFYAGKQIARTMKKGDKYENLKKIIMINILDYAIFPFEEYVSKTVTVLNEHKEYEVIEDVKWYFVELPKLRKSKLDVNKKLNQWLIFIDDEDKEMIEMAEARNRVLKKAREEMEYLTGDAEVERLAYLEEKWEMDYNSDISYAREEGEKHGEKQAKIEMAKKMIKKGKTIEEIIEMTELSKEEIEKL